MLRGEVAGVVGGEWWSALVRAACAVAGLVLVVACGGVVESSDSVISSPSSLVTTTAPIVSPTVLPTPLPTPTPTLMAALVLVVEDEVYRESTSADGPNSTVDIYFGDETERGPVVVLLHGFSVSGAGIPDVDLGPLAEEIVRLGSTVFYFGWQSTFGYRPDSVGDLSCVGPFVAARAAEFGANPDNIVVIGHSMGAETGSMLALSSFDLTPSPNCTETGEPSTPVGFLGIGGAYGMVGGPLDDEPSRFLVRSWPRGTFEELDGDEDVVPGLTAAQIYQLDGFRAIPPVGDPKIVLMVGSEDQYAVSNADVTARFADALRADDVEVDVVIIEGANHEDIVDPASDAGQAALQVLAEFLADVG